jgi:hypothetical protein
MHSADMRIRRIAVLVATLITVGASFGGAVASATVQPATFVGRDTGSGPTLSAAEFAAREQLNADYGPCSGIVLVSDSQLANGTWTAEVAGNCTAFH